MFGCFDIFECSVYSKPYKNKSVFNTVFKTLFTYVVIVSYKRLYFSSKEVGLVLMSRNSAAITFLSSLS